MVDNEREFPSLADPLGETLYELRLNGSLYALSELRAPWGIEMPVLPGKMMFHIVTAGRCWLQTAEGPASELQQGSLVLLPQGRGHLILDSPNAKTEPFFDLPIRDLDLWRSGTINQTNLLCG